MLPIHVCPFMEERRGSSSGDCVTSVRASALPHLPTGSVFRLTRRPTAATPSLTHLATSRGHAWS
jgi:hypothetical protein